MPLPKFKLGKQPNMGKRDGNATQSTNDDGETNLWLKVLAKLNLNNGGNRESDADRIKNPKLLNPRCVQALINQSFMLFEGNRPINCFVKLVQVNKEILDLANHFVTYRFDIRVCGRGAYLDFSSHRNTTWPSIYLNMTKARKIIGLLKPGFVYVYHNPQEHEQSLYDLTSLTPGKIGIYFGKHINLAVVEALASRIVEVKCEYSDMLNNFPAISYEHLYIMNIQNMEQLVNVLKHDAAKLTLDLHDDFQFTNEAVPNVSRVTECVLKSPKSVVLSVIAFLIRKLAFLKKLSVKTDNEVWFDNQSTVDEIISQVVGDYKMYKQVAGMLQRARLVSILEFNVVRCSDYPDLPVNWFDSLLARTDISLIHEGTEVEFGQVTTRFVSNESKLKHEARLGIELTYRENEYVDVDEFENAEYSADDYVDYDDFDDVDYTGGGYSEESYSDEDWY